MDAGGLDIFGLPHSKTTAAHPRYKIIPCPSCNHPNCHRHGHYDRKATHLSTALIRVQRFLCRLCGGTHSILPDFLMPICRWRLGDILLISKRFAGGETAYALARGLCESLACLLHLREWIDKAGAVVAVLAREMGLLDAEPPRPAARHPGEAIALAGHFSRWSTFTHSFSRTFYPARFPLRSSHTILTG